MTLGDLILRFAARLAPREERKEWLAGWQSELWYVRRERSSRASAFCLGAFRDALWLRRNHPDASPPRRTVLDSPVRCLSFLSILAAATLSLALYLPGVRALILPPAYRDPARLIVITAGHGRTISVAQYQMLKALPAFTCVAFYRPLAGNGTQAVASASLSDVLGIPISRQSRLRALPGRFDRWQPVDDAVLAAAQGSAAKGYVLARVGPGFRRPSRIAVAGATLVCAALHEDDLVRAYLLMIFVALFLLPATTSLRLGEYPSTGAGFRRHAFLGAKTALLIAVVLCGTLDLTAIAGSDLQPHAVLVGYIIALRWALNDQRKRCPVCLRRLSNPTRIGSSSQMFLEWYGTEFICTRGHGLLHVPGISTSCYTTQRWLYLDASWSDLFSETVERR